MKLAAQHAARVFVRGRIRRKPRRSPSFWTPAGMRWRNAPRRAPMPFRRRSLPTVSHVWLPQFHLHVGRTGPAGGRLHQISQVPAPATTISWRSFSERRTSPPIVRMQSVRETSSTLFRPYQDVPVPHRVASGLRKSLTVKHVYRASPGAGKTVSYVAGTPQHAIPRVHTRGGASDKLVEGRTMLSRRLQQMIALDLPTSWRIGQHGLHVRPARPEAGGGATITGRAPELVWRAYPGDTMTAQAEVLARGLTTEPRSLPPAPASSVNWQMQGGPATPLLTLDPATMDRLAEDVIRRVERRVRIERERRGV